MNLEEVRKRKEYSQFKAAVAVGTTERTWRRWEQKPSSIPSDILPKIQDTFDLTSDEVLNLLRREAM
jgi:DNA-binding transcriptional regulator YiaG